MRLDIESKKGVPIYLQIEEQIRALVSAGQLQPGEQLPTIRELASDLDVNYNTVARAYRDLDREGVILTQRGRGTFAGGPRNAEQADRHRQEKLQAIADAATTQARRLGYTPTEFAAALVKTLSRWREDVDRAALDM